MRRFVRGLGPFLLSAGLLACSGSEPATKGDAEAEAEAKAEPAKAPPTPEEAVKRFLKKAGKGKLEAGKKYLWESASWRIAGREVAAQGPDDIVSYLEKRNEPLRMRYKANEFYVVGDDVVTTGAWVGKHMGKFGGVEATKKGVGVEGAIVFRTAKGAITEVIEYVDQSLVYAQIGALPVDQVWARRDKPSAIVVPKPKTHVDAGDAKRAEDLTTVHAALAHAEAPTLPANAADSFGYWETASSGVRDGEEASSYFAALRTAVPDLQITVEETWVTDDAVLARTRWRGTQKGPLNGWPSKGATLDIECLEQLEIADAKVGLWTVHFNGHAVLQQMGTTGPLPE